MKNLGHVGPRGHAALLVPDPVLPGCLVVTALACWVPTKRAFVREGGRPWHAALARGWLPSRRADGGGPGRGQVDRILIPNPRV